MNIGRRPEQIDRSEGDVNVSALRSGWRERLSARTRTLLDRDEAAFFRQALSTPCLNALSEARGATLVDADGREVLDFHGNSVHQVGHGHPRVLEAVREQLDRMAFCPRRYTNEPAVRLAERLASISPGRALSKALIAPGGAEAMSMAMKLARLATGRANFVSFAGSFHGATLDTISIGGEAHFRDGVGPLLPGCVHVPAPTPSRCSPALGECASSGVCAGRCLSALERTLRESGPVAAVIGEPIRCTTVDLPPPGYWSRVRQLCDEHGALLIVDEIPLCLGRTGRWFSIDHEGVVPDILVLGKGLGGGVFPMAAMIARPELDIAGRTSLGHFTHEKSPVGAAAALAVMDVIEQEDLLTRSERVGAKLLDDLKALAGEIPIIAHVRGRGMLIGVQLRPLGGVSAEALAEQVLYECLRAGLSFKVSGGDVLTLTPPLNISGDALGRGMGILERALRAAAARAIGGCA